MSPTLVKLAFVALAIGAYVGSAFLDDATVVAALQNIASLIVGGVLLPRPGDARLEGVHPDDLRGQ